MTYRIRDWAKHYENADSRKRVKLMEWVRIPTRQDGKGFRRLITNGGAECFGIWVLLVQLATKMPTRGIFRDDDGDLTDADFADIFGVPVESVRKTLDLLCSDGVRWLERVDCRQIAADDGRSRQIAADNGTIDRDREEKRVYIPPTPLTTADEEFSIDDGFEELWGLYPQKGRTKKPFSQGRYLEAMLAAPDRAAMHERIVAPWRPGGKWLNSRQVAEGFVPALATYLSDQRWLEDPEPKAAVESEAERILRLMSEEEAHGTA